MTTQALLQQAKAACPQLAWLGSEEKNRAILQMADAIEANADVILAANADDFFFTLIHYLSIPSVRSPSHKKY